MIIQLFEYLDIQSVIFEYPALWHRALDFEPHLFQSWACSIAHCSLGYSKIDIAQIDVIALLSFGLTKFGTSLFFPDQILNVISVVLHF